jgi:hypothetical protein
MESMELIHEEECTRCGDEYSHAPRIGDEESLYFYFCSKCVDLFQPERSKREDSRDGDAVL